MIYQKWIFDDICMEGLHPECIVDFIYFSVVHLLKDDTFFSDGANYVPSNMRDV